MSRLSFGRKVRKARRDHDWSQRVVAVRLAAEGLPMSQQTVAKIERGARPTSVDELLALARVFGIEPADLLGDA